MENSSFDKLLNEYLPEEKKSGDKITGKLLRKDNDYGYLNINNKLEGRIRINEIEELEIGDEIEVQIVKENEDFIIVSKNLLEKKEFLNSIKKGGFIRGYIKEKSKGGYIVNLGIMDAFLPFKYSGLNSQYVPNNENFEFEIIEKGNKKLTLSRLNIIEKEKDEYLENIKIGDLVEGTVSNKLDYGLIVDLEKIYALIHFSEIAWDNELKLKNFKIGDKVKAKVIEIDKENKKLKLSIKQLSENPWLEYKNKFSIGQNIDTKVKDVLNFGVIVDLEGREEFIHISELSYKKINNATKEFKKGDSIFCEVIGIDDEKEKIVLSSKKVFEKIWDEIENIYIINDIIPTTIINIKDFGIFTKTNDNLEIFIPRSEISWDKNAKIDFKLNDTIDVKLIEIRKEDKNLVGSIKKLGDSPYEIASSKFAKNEEYDVVVTDIIENGALVKLTDNFKGLIPKKELISDLNVGDTVKAVVFEKNSNKNSILLSVRKIVELEEKKELDELMKIYGV